MSTSDEQAAGPLRVLAYPFTGGAVALALATVAGMVPYLGILGSIAAGAFALPVVRTSGRDAPGADAMPRLLPPPSGLPGELAAGAALFLVYLGPWLLLELLALLSVDVDFPGWVYSLMILPFFLQLVLLIFLPAAVAVLAVEGNPLPALGRGRVVRTAGTLGAAYGGLVAALLLAGAAVYLLGDWFRGQGLAGRFLDALLVAWFWILILHLVGRALRKKGLLDPSGGGARDESVPATTGPRSIPRASF